VWNLTTRILAEAMNRICALVSPQSSEFDIAGLTVFGVHSMHERAGPPVGSGLPVAQAKTARQNRIKAPGRKQ